MKQYTFVLFYAVFTLYAFSSCLNRYAEPKLKIDWKNPRASYGNTITIEPADGSVTFGKNEIIIAPQAENQTYTVSGYYNGQIISKTKNTIIKLNNAYLESTLGKAALKCTAKTEISAVNGTTNYIVADGKSFSRNAALQGKKDLVIGGSGILNVKGDIYHAVEADDVKIKGSGTFLFEGTRKGSAINCQTFTAEEDKTFSCYVLNSRNGIKADDMILIKSGNFYFYDNALALKTSLSKSHKSKPRQITLRGGTFHTFNNQKLYQTDKDAYDATGSTFIVE